MLLTQSYQNMDSQGVFYQQPNASDGAPLPPLEVTLFNPAYDNDKFENTAWTVNGKFGDIKAVYTGGYLDRNVDQVGDYTNYARGNYADYYQCYGPSSAARPEVNLLLAEFHLALGRAKPAPATRTALQHAGRLAPARHRRRLLRGQQAVRSDRLAVQDHPGVYLELAGRIPAACRTSGTIPGTYVQSPGIKNDNTSFFQDQYRDTKQTAFFLSSDFDIIPKVLTVTVGTRHYQFENSMQGSVVSSFGCFDAGVPPTGCHDPSFTATTSMPII